MENIELLNYTNFEEVFEFVCETWEKRANKQGYDLKDPKTRELQLEFFLGAFSIIDGLKVNDPDQSSISPKVLFSAMQGTYIKTS